MDVTLSKIDKIYDTSYIELAIKENSHINVKNTKENYCGKQCNFALLHTAKTDVSLTSSSTKHFITMNKKIIHFDNGLQIKDIPKLEENYQYTCVSKLKNWSAAGALVFLPHLQVQIRKSCFCREIFRFVS